MHKTTVRSADAPYVAGATSGTTALRRRFRRFPPTRVHAAQGTDRDPRCTNDVFHQRRTQCTHGGARARTPPVSPQNNLNTHGAARARTPYTSPAHTALPTVQHELAHCPDRSPQASHTPNTTRFADPVDFIGATRTVRHSTIHPVSPCEKGADPGLPRAAR
jgi:hypothetical protein